MMKMNKWTMALAAAGVVSLSSVAQAQEAAACADALAASTTLSGYVSSSYTLDGESGGTGTSRTIMKTNNGTDDNKYDGFKLDVVSLTLASAQGAGEYATGYTVQLWAGPDDQGTATTGAEEAIEVVQANIDLRLPVGNGLDLKVGQFGTVVGYEVYDYNQNAFFQRGLGFSVEPTHHTGVLASYQLSDNLSVSLGAVNDTTSALTNNNADDGSSAYLTTLSYTVGDNAGMLSGTTLYYGGVHGAGTDNIDTHYVQVGLPVPVEGLSLDFAADWVDGASNADDEIYQVYAAYTLSDKATLNARYEWGSTDGAAGGTAYTGLESVAVGVTYGLWDNVISRVEYMSTSADNQQDDDTVAINLVYSF